MYKLLKNNDFFSGLTTLDVDHTLHLGGLETFPSFFPDPDDIDPHFEGCMRNLELNGKEYPLTPAAGWKGLSIGTLVFQLLDVIRSKRDAGAPLEGCKGSF